MQHWQLTIDADGVAIATLDRADSKTNLLSHEVMQELDTCLNEISAQENLRGLMIRSAKASGFIFGADITEFHHVSSAEEGAKLAADGQAIINRIAALRIPSVAALNGFTLGGGLELALACQYRIAVNGYKRCIGLPEVQLGLQPGWGGTVRSVQIMGAPKALDLFLTGRLLSPQEAQAAGLVDRLCGPDELETVARELLRSRPAPRRAGLTDRTLNWSIVRPHLAKSIRQKLARRINPAHYPAPGQMLDLWVRYGGQGPQALQAEAEGIGRLFMTPTAQNLIRVFHLRDKLRSLAPREAAIKHLHVIGAGVMGGDIAAWSALQGLEVTLQDTDLGALERAETRAAELFARRLKAPGEAEAAATRLVADPEGQGRSTADLVIEAVVERLDVKQSIFQELETEVPAAAILASNTSSLKIEDMASGMARPQRLLGIHFFNPVPQMPLVEIIAGDTTDAGEIQRAIAYVTQIDKLPLPCRSAPGFVVNRILTPYMFEALRAHTDGHSIEEIDAAAVSFGMPVGPVELADQVGLDVALHVARILSETLRAEPPARLAEMVAAGQLGRKSGQGFYRYADGKPVRQPWRGPINEALQDRILLPLINEAVACLADGVVTDPDLIDAGIIFGTGFAPFRGGPIQYARQRGIVEIQKKLTQLAEKYGDHFLPHPGWRNLTA